jgi:hypothetical protein
VAAASSRPVAPSAPQPVVAPVGRASPHCCELLETGTWYRDFCNDIRDAAEVELASYMYDNAAVQDVLLKRLRGRSAFSLNMYVDSEKFGGGGPRLQRSRLKQLRDAGAEVYILKGRTQQGSFHGKAGVVDRRFLYAGSANFTGKSERNEEFCFKMAGPVVRQVLERLARQRHKVSPWSGS